MKKQILIKAEIDTKKDEWGNVVHLKGFSNGKEIQNRIELVGILGILFQQESLPMFKKQIPD